MWQPEIAAPFLTRELSTRRCDPGNRGVGVGDARSRGIGRARQTVTLKSPIHVGHVPSQPSNQSPTLSRLHLVGYFQPLTLRRLHLVEVRSFEVRSVEQPGA